MIVFCTNKYYNIKNGMLRNINLMKSFETGEFLDNYESELDLYLIKYIIENRKLKISKIYFYI